MGRLCLFIGRALCLLVVKNQRHEPGIAAPTHQKQQRPPASLGRLVDPSCKVIDRSDRLLPGLGDHVAGHQTLGLGIGQGFDSCHDQSGFLCDVILGSKVIGDFRQGKTKPHDVPE